MCLVLVLQRVPRSCLYRMQFDVEKSVLCIAEQAYFACIFILRMTTQGGSDQSCFKVIISYLL